MRARLKLIAAVTAAGLFAWPLFERVGTAARPRTWQSPNQAPANAPVVYVSDFDLDINHNWVVMRPAQRSSTSAATGTASPKSAGGSGGTASSSTKLDPDAEARDQANALINAMARNVVKALQANGYEAHRLPGKQARPEKGLLVRGVFAESDEQNRVRRLLFGGPSPSPQMILYVAVNNLKNPDQPLYELANPPAPDSRYGPVITVTSYAPAARFELAKKPSDDEIKDIGGQIAADLTALLSANPLMSAQ